MASRRASRRQRSFERRTRTKVQPCTLLSHRSADVDLAMLTCIFDEIALKISEVYDVRFCDEVTPKIEVSRHTNTFLYRFRMCSLKDTNRHPKI
jgi:hypothetical protein